MAKAREDVTTAAIQVQDLENLISELETEFADDLNKVAEVQQRIRSGRNERETKHIDVLAHEVALLLSLACLE